MTVFDRNDNQENHHEFKAYYMNEKLFNPDYLFSLCQNYGLRPSKKYGQNYLINSEVIEKMIEAADLQADDTVVEVGPGFGVLTFALASKVKKVIAFEIEKKLEKYWTDRAPKNLQIIWGNVLRAELSSSQFKVVANLPYQITSNVIRKFLESPTPPTTMTVMAQKEVAERICAVPGEMSLLAVATQYYAVAEIVAPVPRADFWPAPQVDSAIIRLTMKNAEVIAEQSKNIPTEFLFQVVRVGFANKRKLLIKNLLPLIGKSNKKQLEEGFEGLGLLPTVRAQELSLEEWIEIAKIIQQNTP